MRSMVFNSLALLVAMLVLASHARAAGIITVPLGFSPGDTYRLLFVTRGTTDATSTDIASYNQFVTSQSNATFGHSGNANEYYRSGGQDILTDLKPMYAISGDLVVGGSPQSQAPESGTVGMLIGGLLTLAGLALRKTRPLQRMSLGQPRQLPPLLAAPKEPPAVAELLLPIAGQPRLQFGGQPR